MSEMKECLSCDQEIDSEDVKCWNCDGDEFTNSYQVKEEGVDSDATLQLAKASQNDGIGQEISDLALSIDEKILSALSILIEEQKQTRLAIRWGLFGLGVILLVAFYGRGVKVNLSPTTITPYP